MHPLLDMFERIVESVPRRLAACDESLKLDYQRLHALAGGLAQRIAAETRGPHVGIMVPTSAAGAAAILACWYAGKVPVPLNFLLGPNELGEVVRDAGLECVLTIERFAESLASVGVKAVLLPEALLHPGEAVPPAAAGDDTAAVIYTSGTSGRPKGVCLSFDNLVRNAKACIEHARMNPEQVFLSVIPQFHSFGFTAMTVTPLLLGATAWYLPRFSPPSVVKTIAEKRITIFMGTASMYAAIARMKDADPEALASLRLAISGGEALSPPVAQAFERRFGVRIMEGYGLTGASPVVAVNMPWTYRSGSVGRALPGVEVVAVDDKGQPVAHDEIGELVVRGHCVMKGYHNKPSETAAAIRAGGLYTGDLGRVDADGLIYITGRAKDLIIVGGENVYPAEIENVLMEHAGVEQAAVIGVPDDLRGEVPMAFVVPRAGSAVDEQQLRVFCRQRLAGYKNPREIRIERDLPRAPTGKILKRELKPTRPA